MFFPPTVSSNKYYMFCESKQLTIGSGGGGPAIHLDSELHKGNTNACETFQNPILVLDGVKFEDDEFEAENMELYAF